MRPWPEPSPLDEPPSSQSSVGENGRPRIRECTRRRGPNFVLSRKSTVGGHDRVRWRERCRRCRRHRRRRSVRDHARRQTFLRLLTEASVRGRSGVAPSGPSGSGTGRGRCSRVVLAAKAMYSFQHPTMELLGGNPVSHVVLLEATAPVPVAAAVLYQGRRPATLRVACRGGCHGIAPGCVNVDVADTNVGVRPCSSTVLWVGSASSTAATS